MRRWGFFSWLSIVTAVCLTAAAVNGLIDGQPLSAGFEAVGAACCVASAVLAGKRDGSS